MSPPLADTTRCVPRYSVVRGVHPGPRGGSRLVLESPARELVELDLPCAPDSAADLGTPGFRPLAVRIETGATAGEARCSVLCATPQGPQGPQRVRTSLGTALALCAGGRHTVLTRAT